LVVVSAINFVIAVYYYLVVIQQAIFRGAEDRPPIRLDAATRLLCGLLMAGIVLLGVFPNHVLSALATAVGDLHTAVAGS
jgi:NADH:ubiquinone oxidoreductase subunit 2 (subunit N)